MSSEGIPQIAAVLGSCTAGGAYLPAMSDEAVIVREQGTIFLGGPPLVQGRDRGGRHRRGARRRRSAHAPISGVADHLAADDEDALAIVRSIVATLPRRGTAPRDVPCPSRPRSRSDDCYGVVPADLRAPVRPPRNNRADRRRQPFPRVQGRYGTTLVCGFAHICRATRSGSSPTTACSFRRVAAEGRPLHRVVRPARDPADLPAEHHRVHGRDASTRRAGSRRTARRWSRPWPSPGCRS